MAAKIFSSQNKSSSSERDFLTPCNMHMTVQYAENIARLLQCKMNGNILRSIIIQCTNVLFGLQ